MNLSQNGMCKFSGGDHSRRSSWIWHVRMAGYAAQRQAGTVRFLSGKAVTNGGCVYMTQSNLNSGPRGFF